MSKRKYPMVMIEWEDACHQPGYWDPADNAKKHTSLMCRNMGFLLKSDRKRVIVAAAHFPEDNELRHLEVIPHGMVRKITRLTEMKAKHE